MMKGSKKIIGKKQMLEPKEEFFHMEGRNKNARKRASP